MAMMPKEWKDTPTKEEVETADRLETLIDDALKARPPRAMDENAVIVSIPEAFGAIPTRVRALIIERYLKGPMAPDGWSNAAFRDTVLGPAFDLTV